MFCPKCGSILTPKKDDSKKILVCSCGYKSTDVSSVVIRDTVRDKSRKVEVVTEKKDFSVLPKINTECPKCKHKTALFWTVQTRAGDEPETKFMKCEKCGHTWRDYN